MPKVYVVSRSYHDYSAAESFGELVYLSEASVNKFSTSSMARCFEEKLKCSSPEDYILVAGLQVMGIIASAIFASMHGRLNLLLFKASPKGDSYLARTIILPSSSSSKAQKKE